jgi:hypothetical protein
MSHLQLSRTRPIPDAWRDLTDAQNDGQTAAIYEVIGRHGGDVKVVSFAPSDVSLVSVIEYPDELSAKRSIAEILALETLEYVSVEALWDVVEWVGMVRAAATTT